MSWNRAGNVLARPARAIETRPSSIGCRSASRTSRSNSGSSSRKRTPWSARVISPGDIRGPPPTIAAYEIVWCGLRNGERRTRPVIGPSPAADATIVTDRAASSSRGGRRVGTVLASRVLPEPGGPMSSRPWPPASAISSARLASGWPRTSARSAAGRPGPARDAVGSLPGPTAPPSSSPTLGDPIGLDRDRGERMRSTTSVSVSTGRISTPSTSPASTAAARATTTRRTPRRAIAATIGRMPGTGWTSPPRDSSPSIPIRPLPGRTCSDPSRIPTAIAKSSDAPALRRSAGARLTVIRRGGYAKPALRSAPRIRSRASWSAASASPTIVKPGNPEATSTSTRI